MKVITNMLQKIHSSQIIHGSSSSNLTLQTVLDSLQTQINNINNTLTNNLFKTGISCPNNNANDALSDGCYNFGPSTANKPSNDGYGTIFTMVSAGLTGNNSNNWVNQLAFGTGNTIRFRQKINADNWTAWQTITKS